jgi:hypothetical protein
VVTLRPPVGGPFIDEPVLSRITPLWAAMLRRRAGRKGTFADELAPTLFIL